MRQLNKGREWVILVILMNQTTTDSARPCHIIRILLLFHAWLLYRWLTTCVVSWWESKRVERFLLSPLGVTRTEFTIAENKSKQGQERDEVTMLHTERERDVNVARSKLDRVQSLSRRVHCCGCLDRVRQHTYSPCVMTTGVLEIWPNAVRDYCFNSCK